MKMGFWILLVLVAAAKLPAQTNGPVQLALIAESAEATTAADVLTAQLSDNPKIHLLERDEIEKIYREQGMSAANRDDLKLGRILGADGLLLLDIVRTPQTTNLTARLIAVKPGVVLTDGSFPWPLKDTPQWAESAAAYLNSFLTKLTVPAKDAIPISIVNLRAAVSSADEQETERDLKLLTIQRLSKEQRFFVLERQRMQLLGEEKELKSDESAFWNGSYLLDGTIDQNGYSPETITITARLTPPKGGAPLLFEVSGSRTNLSEVINRLAAKVTELLNVNSTVPQWTATNEAAQFYDEARWALRWGVYSEAQAAAESAWALGKQDMDCATVRIQAYMISPDTGESVIYYPPQQPPDPQDILFILHALQLYNEFSHNLPSDEPKVDSSWYLLGLEDLTVASRVLQVFNWSPDFYKPAAEKLAELRAAARSTAQWISQSPSVHDGYFVGDRVAVYDELYHFEEKPSIFGLKVDCGCLWQETPEDCVALYRELMGSPVFCYLQDRLWFRDSDHNSALRVLPPRLIAWNETDQKRIPYVWNDFVQELNASSNALLQLEAKAVVLADADRETKLAGSFTNFFDAFFENHDALVDNNVEVLYLEWRTGDLIEHMGGDSTSDTKDSLQHIYYSEYRPKIEAMDREYRDKTVFLSTFEKQKRYLKENTPYDFFKFAPLFGSATYSRAQALEIQPLFAAYISNLVTQAKSATGLQKTELEGAIGFVGLMRDNVNRILHPSAPQPQSPPNTPSPEPAPVANVAAQVPVPTNAPEIVTNVIGVNKFFAIPMNQFIDLGMSESINPQYSRVDITAHHWFEGKLLLDFHYDMLVETFDNKGTLIDNRQPRGSAVAIFDPATEHWNVIAGPETDTDMQNSYYHRTVLWHGYLFNCVGGQIRKYYFADQQWQILRISDGNNYELFVVNDHLYAANGTVIFEITDGGGATRILASTRRQPSRSALDTQDLGLPTLFEGPNHVLRVCTVNKVFTWTGSDWREDSKAPLDSTPPEIFGDGVLFRQAGFLNASWQNGVLYRQPNGTYGVLVRQDNIFCLANETNVVSFCLGSGNQADFSSMSRPGANVVPVPEPFWKMPANVLPNPPFALRKSELYILEDSFTAHTLINDRHEILQETAAAKDEYNAVLLFFSHDFPLPQKLFLKFDSPKAETPTWMLPTDNLLIFGSGTPFNRDPNGFIGGNSSEAGIWIVPIPAIESPVIMQKKIQLEQRTREKEEIVAAAEKVQEALLAKYDHNHNGVIDPDEIEAALDDPAFIESELDMIDANHNGLLDPAELAYFDPDKNKILEPHEQAGIEIAEHLLTERLMKKFDASGDGVLDQSEFNNLLASPKTDEAYMQGQPQNFFNWDDNHDGVIDARELESFLKQQLGSKLRPRGMAGAVFFRQLTADPNTAIDPRHMFKAEVEFYWQSSVSPANETPEPNPHWHVP